MGTRTNYSLVILFGTILIVFLVAAGCTGTSPPDNNSTGSAVTSITDGYGRTVSIPSPATRVVCSAGGPCVRYLVYLDATDALIGVDSGDKPNSTTATSRDTRSYTLANPQFANLSLIGSANNNANLEQIIALSPQLIFMMGYVNNQTGDSISPADTMQAKTGIPVVAVTSGSYATEEGRAEMYDSFRLMGRILGKEDRAEQLTVYIDAAIADLDNRTKDIPESEQKTAFIGGLSYSGSHGLMSTQSAYPPFLWDHVKNVANGSVLQTAELSKEGLIYADPDYIFIDAGTLGVQDEISGFEDIRSQVFSDMKAVKNGNVYATLPYNYRSSNLDTILADSYFIGKTVYPDRFTDIDPKEKADEIYTMFVGEPVFGRINANCNNTGFEKVSLTRT